MATLLKAAIAKDFLNEGGQLATHLATIGADAYTRVGVARAQAGSVPHYPYYGYPVMQGGRKRRRSIRPRRSAQRTSASLRRRMHPGQRQSSQKTAVKKRASK